MREDEKQLEGMDLDREEQHTRQRGVEANDDLELRELAGEEVLDTETEYADSLIGAITSILEGRNIEIHALKLPARELSALEHLRNAASGKSAHGKFMYASDRRDLLEGALAVLQPNLTKLDPAKLAEIEGGYAGLVQQISDLRSSLSGLEDAQDDLMDAELEYPDLTKESSDPEDKRDQPSSLSSGPPRPDQRPQPTTLEGPARPEVPKVSSLSEDPKR